MSLTTGILFPRGNIAPGGFKFNQIRKAIQILIFQVQLLWNHIWFQYCVSQRKRTAVSIMDIKDFQTLHFIIGIRKVQGAKEVKVWKKELENQEKSVAGNSEKQSCQPTEVGPQRRHLWGGLWAAAALMLATASVGARPGLGLLLAFGASCPEDRLHAGQRKARTGRGPQGTSVSV